MEKLPKSKALKALQPPSASKPAPINYSVALAMRAFSEGAADKAQQQLVFQWIFHEASGAAHPAYHDSERDTCFALGRRFVAEQMRGLLTADLSVLRGET